MSPIFLCDYLVVLMFFHAKYEIKIITNTTANFVIRRKINFYTTSLFVCICLNLIFKSDNIYL